MVDENLIERFGFMKLSQTSMNSLFSHSQCSKGVTGCVSMYKMKIAKIYFKKLNQKFGNKKENRRNQHKIYDSRLI